MSKTAKKAKVSKGTSKAIRKIVKDELKQDIEAKKVSYGVAPSEIFMGNTSAGGGQYLFQLSNIPQSTTAASDSTRIGDKVKLKDLVLKYSTWNNLGSNALASSMIRVIVFQYKGDSTLEDRHTFMNKLFIGDTSAGGGNNVGPMANRNNDYHGLFNILYDKIHVHCGTTTAAVPPPSNYGQTTVKRISFAKAQKTINYVNASATAGQNNIYLMAWTFNGSVTDNPLFAFESQLFFYDA